MSKVLIALGGNLGDVEAAFMRAKEILANDLYDQRMSRIYRTSPVYDKPGAVQPEEPAPDYYNAALSAQTFREPEPLLQRLLEVEKVLGRVRPAPECAPRTIDLDLILYDDRIIRPQNPGDLELPHPRMHQRRFVLEPACDIEPDWIHPVFHQSLREILDKLQD